MEVKREGASGTDPEAKAQQILERRNRAYRILYDTVVEVEAVTEENTYLALCRNLRHICGGAFAALASYDVETGRTILRAMDADDSIELPLPGAPEQPAGMISEDMGRHFLNISVSMCNRKEICLLKKMAPKVAETLSNMDGDCYQLSCIRNRKPVAVGVVRLPRGKRLLQRDIVDTFLNFAGIVIERVNAVRTLRENEEFVRATIESTAEAILAVDNGGRVTHWNRHFLDMWGISEEVVATCGCDKLFELLAKQLVASEEFLSHTSRFYSSSEKKSDTIYFLDGRACEHSSSPLEINNRISGRVISFRDITERIHTEEKLRAAKSAAENANCAKSDFVANMSHEIRTPMNGILGMTDLALDTDLSDEQREYMNMVKESGNWLLEVINEILDFSKIEAGKLELERIDFNLRKCVDRAVRLLALQAEQKGIDLLYRIAPNVPDDLIGDAGRLRQILVNLVGNAVKFTKKGEVIVEIERRGSTEGGTRLRFTVSDTGIGISPEKQRVIFSAFEQADNSTSRTYGGTGLGLAITASLVQLMGGNISVESRPGMGSTFGFDIHFDCQRSAPPNPSLGRLEGVRVLIAGGNRKNRQILAELLDEWKMVTVSVPDRETALAEWRHARDADDPYRVVLIDQNTPDSGGRSLAKEIRAESDSDSPVILLLSSAADPTFASQCREIANTAHITKPVCQPDLEMALLKIMGISEKRSSDEGPGSEKNRPAYGSLNILLAEDNHVNQIFAIRLLEKDGHCVTVVNNGVEAVAALENGLYDVVLMDIQMPEMDGFEATARIRASDSRVTNREIPIIALTAHAMAGDRNCCLDAGMNYHVTKPLKKARLDDAFERLFAARHQ